MLRLPRRGALLALALTSACLSPGKKQDPSTDVTPPSVPAHVVASSPTPTRIDLSWDASSDAGSGVAGYIIHRDGSLVGTVFAPTTTFQEDGLTAATAYGFTVQAFDRATPPNISEPSATADVTTLASSDVTAPTVPANVTAVSTLPSRVVVSWDASVDAESGVGGYEVLRGGTRVGTVDAPAVTWQDDGLTASTAYLYTVRAFDRAVPPNVSAPSSAANVTTMAPDLTPPTIPQGVVATPLSFDAVRVTWSASTDSATGVAGYQVRRGGNLVATVGTSTLLYEETGLTESTAYGYTVRAFDAAVPPNVSGDSAAASATTPPRPPGLDRRPSNTTCLATAAPSQNALVFRSDPWPALPHFTSPTKMLQPPGDPSRWFVLEQTGKVKSFENVASVSTVTEVIDLAADPARNFKSGGEMGLLGMAFDPRWPAVKEAFLLYTTQIGVTNARQTHISRFRSTDGVHLDPASEQIVLAVDQPDAGHKAGDMHFGADSFLYAMLGDGGGVYGQWGTTQNLNTVLAKLLRIDVLDTGAGYNIPPGNPYAQNPKCHADGSSTQPCPEMYAFGFRNPWRWSFDKVSQDIWAADVGQDRWEEVDRISIGHNYGWNLREGTHCADDTTTVCGSVGSDLLGGILTDPEVDYPHGDTALSGHSVTGGYVYRGTAIPLLSGLYVFTDFLTGQVWTHAPGAQGDMQVLFNAGVPVSSFGQDVSTGELYLTDYAQGKLYGIAPQAAGGGVDPVPMDLATACPSAIDPDGAGSVLIPYALNAPFWSDGALKQRWMALPNGATVTIEPSSLDWTFPVGTVLVKQFKLQGKVVETRLLMHHTDGSWAGYSYEWNDAGTAATRVLGGKTKPIGAQTWLYPSSQQCLQCHTGAAGSTLGPETAQQNGDYTYPSTGRTANQLASLAAIGVFTLPGPPATLPALPAPFGTGDLEQRARAYLHSNCSNCHRPGGGTPVQMDLRYSTPLAQANICNTNPSAGDLGIVGARLVKPGAPTQSIVLERLKRVDGFRMPPLGRFLQDPQGVQLITDWITQLSGCP